MQGDQGNQNTGNTQAKYTPSFSMAQPVAPQQQAQQGMSQPQMPTQQMPPSTPMPEPNIDKPMVSKSGADKVADLFILLFYGIAFIILFRFVLSLVGANQDTVFVNFIYQISTPFLAPFLSMFGKPLAVQAYRLEMEDLVALLVYGAVMFGIAKLIRIIFR